MTRLLALLERACADLSALLSIAQGLQSHHQQLRRPLGPDSLLTFEEVRAEVGWGEAETRRWLKGLPIRRYPGRRTVQYRWGDVLAFLPAEEPAQALPSPTACPEASPELSVRPRRFGAAR